MFQDRPSQQVQNCPSQQRTGPAVQVAIDKLKNEELQLKTEELSIMDKILSQKTKGYGCTG